VEADQKQRKNRNALNSLAAVIHKTKCNAAGNRRSCALEKLSDSTNADLRNSRTQMIFRLHFRKAGSKSSFYDDVHE